MFPTDSITVTEIVQGVVSVNVSTADPSTILSVAIQQQNNSSNTLVLCGNEVVAKNYATNFSQVQMSYECEDFITVSKTGNDEASVIITYVPYHISDIPSVYNVSDEVATSTDVYLYSTFTAGETLIALFIFLLIVIEIVKGITSGIMRIKTGKTILAYNGGDVEIRHDL